MQSWSPEIGGSYWGLRFELPDASWDAESILELRRVDPESWQRFTKLFRRFSELASGVVGESWEQARELAQWYHDGLRRTCLDSIQTLSVAWASLHERWMYYLDELLGRPCQIEQPVSCLASLSLLSPRNLAQRRFSVPFYIALSRQTAICAHEILHFRYFEWLKACRPDIPPEHYDAPHHAWRVSEVIAAAISNDPFAIDCFGPGADSCYACEDKVFTRVRDAWHEHRRSGADFSVFYELASQLTPERNQGHENQ